MGSINFDSSNGSSWLLESLQRQNHSYSTHLVKMEPDDDYLHTLSQQIKRVVEGADVTRPLNEDINKTIKFPVLQMNALPESVPQDVMNIYWDLNQQGYVMKQVTMNKYLQIEPHRFLTNPTTELRAFMRNHDILKTAKTNNDASRRSRLKKKIHTELLLESYECDMAEGELLDEEERQLHLIIAVLEDMVYEKSGSTEVIECYRNMSCLQ